LLQVFVYHENTVAVAVVTTVYGSNIVERERYAQNGLFTYTGNKK